MAKKDKTKIKTFGIVDSVRKIGKYESKVKFRLMDDEYDCYYNSYCPITDKLIKKELSDLKRKLVEFLTFATLHHKIQIVKIGNAEYTLYPNGDEKIIKGFKTTQW